MTFEIEVNGRTRTVSVERLDGSEALTGHFRLRVDDVAYDIESAPTDLGLSLIDRRDGRSIDIAVTERASGEWLLQFPHIDLVATVDRHRFGRRASSGVAAAGEHRVMAPMPGRIVRVLVKAGDDVAPRQGLVVVEAMKMENELAAPKPGRVREVAVTEGMSVEAGRLLVVID